MRLVDRRCLFRVFDFLWCPSPHSRRSARTPHSNSATPGFVTSRGLVVPGRRGPGVQGGDTEPHPLDWAPIGVESSRPAWGRKVGWGELTHPPSTHSYYL